MAHFNLTTKPQFRHLTYTTKSGYSELKFHHKIWEIFEYKQIEDRLRAWTRIAEGHYFRRPVNWHFIGEELYVQLPPLPEAYLPFSHIQEANLSHPDKINLLLSLAEALSQLHQQQFYMGLIWPDMIYFDPHSLHIIMDIQPFPSAIEFINHLVEDYPFDAISRFARRFRLSRIADFEAMHALIHTMFESLPACLQPLSVQLAEKPETILFAEEIADYLRICLGLAPQRPHLTYSTPDWLHPAAPPITQEQQESLSLFFNSNQESLIALLCEDEAIRNDIFSHYINEVLEKGYFFKIVCQDLPYSTLREVVSRTLNIAYDVLPESTTLLRNLARKFDQLLKKHYEGVDILYALTDWLNQFFTHMIPIFPVQNFYYIFENCEHFDEDSHLILQNYWHEHGHQVSGLHAILSGSRMPAQLQDSSYRTIEIRHSDPAIYEKLLYSQFGRADDTLIADLKDWFYRQPNKVSHCRIIIEQLIQEGCIQLTHAGWSKTALFKLDAEKLNAAQLFAHRIALLDDDQLHLLRVLSCLPMPIAARSLFSANRFDLGVIYSHIYELSQLGLIQVSHYDNLYIAKEITEFVLQPLSPDESKHYYRLALRYQHQYRPAALPQLIALAKQAEESQVEYYLLLKYYRQVRSRLSYKQKLYLLELIKTLHSRLKRPYLIFLDRLLSRIYQLLNQLALSEQLALSVYEQTGRTTDRYGWMYIQLLQNKLDVYQLREELFPLLYDEHYPFEDRVRAAFLLNTSNLCFPLQDEEMHQLHAFYSELVYPQRNSITLRHFAELTNYYVINMLIHFPETEDWALAVAAKLEALLEASSHTDLMLRLYDMYSYQSNNKLISTYVYRGIEGAERSGYTIKEQVGHLNAMEFSLHQGDLASYRYHKERVLEVDAIRRKDLADEYLIYQFLHAIEWEQWDLFHELQTHLFAQQMTEANLTHWTVYRTYAYFRQKKPLTLPVSSVVKDSASAIFLEALFHASEGNDTMACQLFQQFIRKSNSGIYAGWAYRELLTIMLKLRMENSGEWFEKFEAYLKRCSFDLFWPDYYRLCAEKSIQDADIQHAMLYLRRALNGYQIIEKESWQHDLAAAMDEVMLPAGRIADTSIVQHEFVQQMISDREQWLLLSLDLQIIIELSEQITDTLDMTTAIQRLTKALFDYFPVIQLTIAYNLLHYTHKFFVTASGHRDHDELTAYQQRSEASSVLTFTLFQRGDQSITLQALVEGISKTKLQHMEHFLAFIKPHISNVLLHREMVIDNLTGFFLRGHFMEKLREEFALSSRYDLDLSLIMIDIDNFRKVNEFGHAEGDRVLREISDIFRSSLRKSDIPGRYGGEELIIILPKTDGKVALKIANHLRSQIEREFAYGRPYQVTVSVGVSSHQLCHPDTVEQLIEQADQAEITAKRTGKNKVIAAWDERKSLQ
ncbi:GGDEF domain-containing protein [Paenibacillus aestuarii]|uniref:GGDEF domain-containing protein n=1 Tax=Paenibacillus aestuarii TaxID=516965 RepID=A0ABW0K3Q5_9BACL|nr:GGDEF domain-containing protein [Paenibacillus aestuarii]